MYRIPLCVIIVLPFLMNDPSAYANPQPRLLNSTFDRCQAGGVACEWEFTGDGAPVNKSVQGITKIPAGAAAALRQRVPLCVPGRRYRARLQVSPRSDPSLTIEIGLDPSNSNNPLLPVWALVGPGGTATVETVAAETVLTVTVRVTNNGKTSADAWLDAVMLEPVGMEGSLPEPSQALSAAEVEEASAELIDALAALRGARFGEARDTFAGLVQSASASRAQAARALIGLQEVAHAEDYAVRQLPLEDQFDAIGLPYLRAVVENYPDQPAACALASCKMGEFYLSRQILPLAKDLLNDTVNHYPDTPGALWSRAYLINAHLWEGNPAAASATLAELRDAFAQGKATAEQVGWGEYFYETQTIAATRRADTRDRLEAVRERYWQTYRDTFPELALRAKTRNAEAFIERGLLYRGMDDLREAIAAHPGNRTYVAGACMDLARCLYVYGTEQQHHREAFELLNRVEADPQTPEYIREQAVQFHAELSRRWPGPRAVPTYGHNLLDNPRFEVPNDDQEESGSAFRFWRIARDYQSTNWDGCNWSIGAPSPGLESHTPAWNSVNLGTPAGSVLESRLLADAVVIDESDFLDFEIHVAAEGWDGGTAADVTFALSLSYQDCFFRPLGTSTTGPLFHSGADQEWVRLTFSDTAPPGARFVEAGVTFHAEGDGHHAVAVTHAHLEATEGGN